jgi:excisionase family DNA binding protein
MSQPAADLLATLLNDAGEPELRTLAERLRPYLSDDDRLLSATEAGARLGLHPETVVRFAREGRIPGAIKIGREWRMPPHASVLAAGTASPPRVPTAPAARRRRTSKRSSVAAMLSAPNRYA